MLRSCVREDCIALRTASHDILLLSNVVERQVQLKYLLILLGGPHCTRKDWEIHREAESNILSIMGTMVYAEQWRRLLPRLGTSTHTLRSLKLFRYA